MKVEDPVFAAIPEVPGVTLPVDPFAPLEPLRYKETLVPVVQGLLSQGLPLEVLRSSLRLGDFTLFKGGLKAPLVGGLRVDLRLVLKVGDAELVTHRAMMDAVNAVHPRTFPFVYHESDLGDGRHVLLMEEFVGYRPLLRWVYESDISLAQVDQLTERAVRAVRAVHDAGLSDLPRNDDPYTRRVIDKMEHALAVLPDGQVLRERGGLLVLADGDRLPCPPWAVLRSMIASCGPFQGDLVPVHGDPHLGNIMIRRRGPKGWSLRLIDPNPGVGLTDPLYDLGKLLHWADPVGWTQVGGWNGGARLSSADGEWTLQELHVPPSKAAEERRKRIRLRLMEMAHAFGDPTAPGFDRRLHLAIASAHVGLADLLAGNLESQRAKGCAEATADTLRFVVFHALWRLARAFQV